MTVYLIAWYDKATLEFKGISSSGYQSELETLEAIRIIEENDMDGARNKPVLYVCYAKPAKTVI